jgi:hypothetical protein
VVFKLALSLFFYLKMKGEKRMRTFTILIMIISLLLVGFWNVSRPVVDNYIEEFEWNRTYQVK